MPAGTLEDSAQPSGGAASPRRGWSRGRGTAARALPRGGPAWPARVRPDSLPRQLQPWLTGLAVPAAISCCHARQAGAPSRGLPGGDRSSALRRHLELAGRHLAPARTSRRQSGRACAPEPNVSGVLGARPRHAPALAPPANLTSPLTLCDVTGAGCC